MNAQLSTLAAVEFALVWCNETGRTYHIYGNLKLPSAIIQDTGIVNNNVQSLKCCVCFFERLCNTNKRF
jgi:hypothetical protein